MRQGAHARPFTRLFDRLAEKCFGFYWACVPLTVPTDKTNL